MKQKEVFNKIGGIIKELNDQYEYLQTVTENLNDLELELFVSNAHFLTHHIEILCKLNLQNSNKNVAPEQEPPREQKYFEPVVQQLKHAEEKETKPADTQAKDQQEATPVPEIDLTSENSGDSFSYTRQEPETIRHELILDESINWEDDDEDLPDDNDLLAEEESSAPAVAELPPPEPQDTPVAKPAVNKQKPAAANKTSEDEVITINQKMSSQLREKTKGQTENTGITPISDLKPAINLNDKLLYIKDLFNGYSLAYSEAIEILNRFNTYEEATRFLKSNYATKNKWESKPETADKFYALLKRRYA